MKRKDRFLILLAVLMVVPVTGTFAENLINDQIQSAFDTIIDDARSSEIGDGKNFVMLIEQPLRIRSGETGGGGYRIVTGVCI